MTAGPSDHTLMKARLLIIVATFERGKIFYPLQIMTESAIYRVPTIS